MLATLRNSAGSWVAKILFGLLILSFGVWGIGDMVTSGASRKPAITVGDIEISAEAVVTQYNRQVDQLRQQSGGAITAELARSMGLVDNVVQNMARTALLDMAAQDMEITVSEDALRQVIVSERGFQDSSGAFSRDVYMETLRRNNMTEKAYVRQLNVDIARERLASAIAGYGAAPTIQAEALFRLYQEQRSAKALTVDASKVTLDETPADDVLMALYDEQKTTSFMAPEYRKLTAIALTAKAMESRVSVSDQDITDFYTANPDQFNQPERREISQAIVDSEDKAKAIVAAVNGGTAFDEAAKAADSTVMPMGTVARSDLPDEFATSVFDLSPGQVSAPIESAFGWHVFAVSAVFAPSLPTLDDVRETVRQRIAAERAIDALYAESTKLDDALGGGATLEEAAKTLDLPLITIEATSIDGLAPDGSKAAGLPTETAQTSVGPTILKTAFTLDSGAESRLEPAGENAYTLVRVDSITQAQPRPYESVKTEVLGMWQEQRRHDLAIALANDLLAKVKGGADMAALAAGNPAVTLSEPSAITRTDALTDLPRSATATLFTLTQGDAAMVEAPTGASVIVLTGIIAANPADKPDQMIQQTMRLRTSIGQDLLAQTIQALQVTYPISINRSVIDQAL